MTEGSATRAGQPAIGRALQGLIDTFAADGYTMTVSGPQRGCLQITVEAGEAACEECLIPKEVLVGLVEQSLPAEAGISSIEISYPSER